MHRIDPKTGKLVPERCSGYPFCDTCAPPKPKLNQHSGKTRMKNEEFDYPKLPADPFDNNV